MNRCEMHNFYRAIQAMLLPGRISDKTNSNCFERKFYYRALNKLSSPYQVMNRLQQILVLHDEMKKLIIAVATKRTQRIEILVEFVEVA